MEEVASYEIEFVRPSDSLVTGFSTSAGNEGSAAESNASLVPPLDMTTSSGSELHLPMCKREDFQKKYWSGRWTRELETKNCEYSRYGRWICVDKDLQCQRPWCEGKVGSLESNGWVYSAHCAFKIFTEKEAWQCLDVRWLFFWGDSNHMDTMRNLLNFVMGFEFKIGFLDRRMDTTFVHPRTNRSSVRITSMFNGHSNVTKNYEGLYSLHDPEYRAQLRSFFTGETAPDVMIMNPGLHDGIYWRDVESFFTVGMGNAIEFWTDVWSKMKASLPGLILQNHRLHGRKLPEHVVQSPKDGALQPPHGRSLRGHGIRAVPHHRRIRLHLPVALRPQDQRRRPLRPSTLQVPVGG